MVNARPDDFVAPFPPGADQLELHPALGALESDPGLQQCTVDNAAKRLTVSPRTAAVFLSRR